jgi:hypothetical protein
VTLQEQQRQIDLKIAPFPAKEKKTRKQRSTTCETSVLTQPSTTDPIARLENETALLSDVSDEPRNWSEVVESDKREEWREAMEKEIESLQRLGTWEVVERPKGVAVVGSRWVFKTKLTPTGEIEKLKARVVAKGYTQRQGVNYEETFAPVVKAETIRYAINVALNQQLEIHHIDVDSAYLYADLNEEIFMSVPEGVEAIDFDEPVCKLKKALYGLKQAGRNWNETLTKFLIEQGFQQSASDACLFIRSKTEFVLLYVDDCLLCGSTGAVAAMKAEFSAKFGIKDKGALSAFLGIVFERFINSISVFQPFFIDSVLSRFGMSDCRPVTTPGSKQSDNDDPDSSEVDLTSYQSGVESLAYLATHSRPDLAYSVQVLAQSMRAPTSGDWQRFKRVLRFLKYSRDWKLKFTRSGSMEVIGYSDADFANGTDRKSIGGYCFIMNGGAISWKSKKSKVSSRRLLPRANMLPWELP